jgi:aminopeptidase N
VEVPGFFLAHELAHQWWGDGVAGQSYHDRWISEGTAQYAAALWVLRSRGVDAFQDIMRDMADWALRKTEAGPLALGHRIGHLDDDSKLFRAVVYDKGAWVLHMLRGIIGEAAFRAGLVAFQAEHRFQKAGTSDLRRALEKAGGRDLAPYFETWVYRTELPQLSLDRTQDVVANGFRTTVRVKVRDLPGPVPLQITLRLRDGTQTHIETLTPEGGRWEYVTAAPPRKVEINEDLGLLARRND